MENSDAKNSSPFTDKSTAVALIIIARYLLEKDSQFGSYLEMSLRHALSVNLSDADLAVLRLILASLGITGS